MPKAPSVTTGPSGDAYGRQAAEVELPVLDEDADDDAEDDEDAEAAGFASEPEPVDPEDPVDVDEAEDFDAPGELLDDEPRLSFR